VGGFFFASKERGIDVEKALLTSRQQFGRAGFQAPVTFDTEHYTIDYYPKIRYEARNHVVFDNGDFIFAAGTFIYNGRIGADALKLFYDRSDHREELAASSGHYVIVLLKGGQTSLFRDRLGAYSVFLTPGLRCASSSLIVAASTSDRRTINAQEVYEYVFTGGNFGSSTPFSEIRRLDIHEEMRLDPSPSILRHKIEICPEERSESFSDLADLNLQGLLERSSELTALFGSNIRVALSGGYDSRLLLALFRRSGITPHLFVYGNARDQDVVMAKGIAKAEGLDLVHTDKTLLRDVRVEDYPTVVETNFIHDDALPSGGIFTNGAELIARAERNAGGALHVNGGGGEVFRNFFNLWDRSITPRQFVWLFYRGFDPAQCAASFDSDAYEARIAEKILALMGMTGGTLSRRQAECLYPYLRCRSWFGRENTVNNRWGYSVLPFFDYRAVSEALRIPIRYKNFGNFESTLVRRADASLAAYPSNYGHNFAADAPFSAVVKDMLTYCRPLRLRRHAFSIKSRLAKTRPRPTLLSEAFLGRVIDTKFPYMSKYFRVDKVKFDYQFARICTLEYLFSRMSAR
jgi:hypothetical protein